MKYAKYLRRAVLVSFTAARLFNTTPAVATRDADAPLPFKGHALVVLSDADMVASAMSMACSARAKARTC
jgi:hypothetical protein